MSGRPTGAGEERELWVIGAQGCIEVAASIGRLARFCEFGLMRARPDSRDIGDAGLEQLLIAALRGNLETKRTRTHGDLDLSRRERPVAAAPRARAFARLPNHFVNLGPARC